jgi:chaperonin GroES
MKFRPLHDRVVVRRIDEEETSIGGIIIPDTAKEKPMEGEVIAVGPGARDESGKIHRTEIKIDDEELLIMKESDIMGVIEVANIRRKAA